MKKSIKKSPLERLAEIAQEQALPVKLKPKSRFPKEVITPIIEDTAVINLLDLSSEFPTISERIVITNSSLNLHFNFNVDDKAVNKVLEGSKQALKGLAAAGAAMLGTVIFLGNKKMDKVKIPLLPKIKAPRIK